MNGLTGWRKELAVLGLIGLGCLLAAVSYGLFVLASYCFGLGGWYYIGSILFGIFGFKVFCMLVSYLFWSWIYFGGR